MIPINEIADKIADQMKFDGVEMEPEIFNEYYDTIVSDCGNFSVSTYELVTKLKTTSQIFQGTKLQICVDHKRREVAIKNRYFNL